VTLLLADFVTFNQIHGSSRDVRLERDRAGRFDEPGMYSVGSGMVLARIMQQVQGFCMSVEQACVSNSIA
jgi:hypothetical protein